MRSSGTPAARASCSTGLGMGTALLPRPLGLPGCDTTAATCARAAGCVLGRAAARAHAARGPAPPARWRPPPPRPPRSCCPGRWPPPATPPAPAPPPARAGWLVRVRRAAASAPRRRGARTAPQARPGRKGAGGVRAPRTSGVPRKTSRCLGAAAAAARRRAAPGAAPRDGTANGAPRRQRRRQALEARAIGRGGAYAIASRRRAPIRGQGGRRCVRARSPIWEHCLCGCDVSVTALNVPDASQARGTCPHGAPAARAARGSARGLRARSRRSFAGVGAASTALRASHCGQFTRRRRAPASAPPQLERAVRRRADQELPAAVERDRLRRVLVACKLCERRGRRAADAVAAHAPVVARHREHLRARACVRWSPAAPRPPPRAQAWGWRAAPRRRRSARRRRRRRAPRTAPLGSKAALLTGYLLTAMLPISATMRTSHSLTAPSGGGARERVSCVVCEHALGVRGRGPKSLQTSSMARLRHALWRAAKGLLTRRARTRVARREGAAVQRVRDAVDAVGVAVVRLHAEAAARVPGGHRLVARRCGGLSQVRSAWRHRLCTRTQRGTGGGAGAARRGAALRSASRRPPVDTAAP